MHLLLSVHCTASGSAASSRSMYVGVFVHRLSAPTGVDCFCTLWICFGSVAFKELVFRRNMTRTCFAITHVVLAKNGRFCLSSLWSPKPQQSSPRPKRQRPMWFIAVFLYCRVTLVHKNQRPFKPRLIKVDRNRISLRWREGPHSCFSVWNSTFFIR